MLWECYASGQVSYISGGGGTRPTSYVVQVVPPPRDLEKFKPADGGEGANMPLDGALPPTSGRGQICH